MKLAAAQRTRKLLVFGLLALLCFYNTACENPVMAKWWPEPAPKSGDETPILPGDGSGKSGDNFGIVHFDLGFIPVLSSGEGPHPKNLNIAWGSPVGRLRPIARSGWGFTGWLDENGVPWDVETRPVTTGDDVDEDGFITLTASWSLTTYTIRFVTNNPNAAIDDQVVGKDGKIIQPVNPAQRGDGYGFAGWYTDDKTFAGQWDFRDQVNADMILYGKWEPNPRTVLFVANGGTRPDGSEMTRVHFAVPAGYYIQDPGALVKAGHSFGGWFADFNFSGLPWSFTTNQVATGEDYLYLYAKWVQNKYIVKFVVTPSTAAVSDQIIPHGERVAEPAGIPKLDDRKIVGWYTVDGDTHADGWHVKNVWSFSSSVVTDNMTLYARWESPAPDPGAGPGKGEESGDNFGVVVFDADGGTPQPKAVKAAWGNAVGRLRPVSKTGSGFVGWFDENGALWDVETRPVTKADDVDGDGFITLTVQWSKTTYTVKFVTNSPDTVADQIVGSGGRVTKPVNPQRANYGFAGWYSNSAFSGELWNFADGAVTKNMTLYAKWDNQFRTVLFEENGGTRPDGVTLLTHNQTISLNYGYVQDPGPIIKTGYSFNGWYENSACTIPWDFAASKINASTPEPFILYALWEINTYFVNFDANADPHTVTAPDSQKIDHGSKAIQPKSLSPLPDHRTFGGWYRDEECLFKWNFSDPVYGNMTLHAKWLDPPPAPPAPPEPEPEESGDNFGVVIFETDGGTPQPKAVKAAWGSAVGRLRPISKTGNGFVGWLDENGAPWDVESRPVTKADDVDGDGFITLKIKWSEIVYTVQFYTNTPVGSVASQSVGHGGKITEPLSPEGEPGNGFAGWYDNIAFTGQPWNFSSGAVTQNMKLFAKWDNLFCTVFFAANGGTRPDGATALTHTQTISLSYGLVQDPGPLVRTGYSFGGWYEENSFTNQWDFANSKVTSIGTRTLYAKWEKNTYLVDFVITPSTAAVPITQKIIHGGYVQPQDMPPLDNGSSFAGWYRDQGYFYRWNFNDPVTSSMTLYARWVSPVVVIPEPEPKPPEGGESGDNFAVVVFDTNGGTPQPKALKLAWGNVVGRLRSVSRGTDGFLGWYDERGNLWDVETQKVEKDNRYDADEDGFITLTARWQPFTVITVFTVIFEIAPSEDTPPDTQYIAAGGKVVLPVNPARMEEKGFDGWFTEPAGIHRWNFDLPVSTNVTLYAKWVDDIRTVQFEANGGTRPDGATQLNHVQKISIDYGFVQDPGPLVKEGYSFGGWYRDDNTFNTQWSFVNDKVTASTPNPMTLYAKWVKNVYLVNFVITPSTAAIPGTQTVTHGEKAVRPDPDPPQLGTGEGFQGWYTEQAFTNLWDYNTPVTGNIILYAKYVPQTRTVHFQVNGGTTMSGQDYLPNRTIPIASGRIMDPGTLIKPGYSFGGWYTDPACTIPWNFTTDKLTVPDLIIGMDYFYLYAKWTPNIYTVTFVTTEGTPVPDQQKPAYNERVNRPATPVNPGRVLLGWFTGNGNGGQWGTIWDFDTPVKTNLNLYAKWDDASYIVRFHLGSHSLIPSSFSAPEEQNLRLGGKAVEPFMPPLPPNNKINWSFYGWYASVNPATLPAVINSGALTAAGRDSYLGNDPWDFDQGVDDTVTVTEGASRVLNLYARWVEPEPDMVWVPRGSFIMGDSGVSGSPAAYHSYPTRRVTLDGFYISRYEVTEINSPDTSRGYKTITGGNPSQFSKNTFRPVERVSWYDAIDYCNKLTAADMSAADQVYSINVISEGDVLSGTGTPGIKPITNAAVTADWAKKGYRLPTEAEWEYAARGGDGSPGNFTYAGSNDAAAVAWYNETVKGQPAGLQATQTVGSKAANALGIYDMNGNVSEWVWDWFDSYKNIINGANYTVTPETSQYINPRGPDSSPDGTRVRRGGGWSNAVGNIRNVVRNSDTPDTAHWVVGFRVVRGPSTIW